MKRASSKKKDSRSAWAEVTGKRAMKAAGLRMRGKEASPAPAVTPTSPVIPVLCLPKAPMNGGGRAARKGNTHCDDHDKGDTVSVKKKSMKKEKKLLVKQVKRSDQKPQRVKRCNKDTYPAASGSPSFDIPGQYDKISETRRLTSTSKKQKNQDIVMDLIKQNVLENERLRQKFKQHREKE